MFGSLFLPLKHPQYLRLYLAGLISQVGDALTWVGLALLAYTLSGSNSSAVLATALTIRVLTFVFLSPIAGVLADRMNRKITLVFCDFGRVLVIGLMALAGEVWQVYLLMFLLNALTAFFNPTSQATIPLLVGKDDTNKAFALSSATAELIGILGPALAGVLAALIGTRALFSVDASSFLVSGLLILTLRGTLTGVQDKKEKEKISVLQDLPTGSKILWKTPVLRYALLMQLVGALVGAMVLVNTVGRVEGDLQLTEKEFGWVMGFYGLGATLASLAVGQWGEKWGYTRFIGLGAITTALALLPGDHVGLLPLILLWMVVGVGQNWVNLPSETLIAQKVTAAEQGRVFGAHFAWSHLWWAFGYPIAGFLGKTQPDQHFLIGGGLALILGFVFLLTFKTKETK